MNNYIKIASCAAMVAPLASCVAQSEVRPNVVIIFTDDQGYQDLGCFDSPKIKTPNIDELAKDGMLLSSFYVSASVSSASRASLMTGRLNTKNGVYGALFPSDAGLPSSEVTLAESLREVGYATGIFGKWHLGDLDGELPLDQGFDEFYGTPFSNDMYIGSTHKFDNNVKFREGYTLEKAEYEQTLTLTREMAKPHFKQILNKVPLFEGDKIIEYPFDQSTSTKRYIDRAIQFIKSHKDEPFFAYITPNMPHIPLSASEQFRGTSEGGLYGDCIEEIDWNVGRLLTMLEDEGLSDNTIVIFATDNGPWVTLGDRSLAGHADPLREGKFSQYEGGVRTPCVVRWPRVVPAGTESDNIVASIDIYPTIMHYAGVDRINHDIDGIDQSSLFENPETVVRDEYLYVRYGKPYGIRKGDWVYLPKSGAYKPETNIGPELFNIKSDIGQYENLYTKYPEKVAQMQELLDKY
ncbi:MAG: sulfatase-like hydrolase/transferase [Rikenellaceae bacterium]